MRGKQTGIGMRVYLQNSSHLFLSTIFNTFINSVDYEMNECMKQMIIDVISFWVIAVANQLLQSNAIFIIPTNKSRPKH